MSLLFQRGFAVVVTAFAVAFTLCGKNARSTPATPQVASAAKPELFSSDATPVSATIVSATYTGRVLDLASGAKKLVRDVDMQDARNGSRYGMQFAETYTLNFVLREARGIRTAAIGSFHSDEVFHVLARRTPVTTLRLRDVEVTGEEMMRGEFGIATTTAYLPTAKSMRGVQGGWDNSGDAPYVRPQGRGTCGAQQSETLSTTVRDIKGEINVDGCKAPTTVTTAGRVGWDIDDKTEPPADVEGVCTDLLPKRGPGKENQESLFLQRVVRDRRGVNVLWRQTVTRRQRTLSVKYYRNIPNGAYNHTKIVRYIVEEFGEPELVVTKGEPCDGDNPAATTNYRKP